MPFAIAADFPLGTYRGSVGDGEQDRIPSPARVHAALLAAAAQRPSSTVHDGVGMPSDTDLAALEWFEENPPDGIVLPSIAFNKPSATAYRELGVLKPKQRGTKKAPKDDQMNVAYRSEVLWVWEQEPPAHVVEALADLCPDVPYLGRSDSPVRLRTLTGGAFPARATHQRTYDITEARSPAARELEVALPGRTKALRSHHAHASRLKPTLAGDRARSDEVELRPANLPAATEGAFYAPVTSDGSTAQVPWRDVWLLPILNGGHIGEHDRVQWAVAMHRALIRKHDDGGIPPVLTGNYLDGVPKPANRISIQVVDRHPLMSQAALDAMHGQRQALALAIPHGADPGEIDGVIDASTRLRKVYRPRSLTLGVEAPDGPVSGAGFWQPPEQAMVRCWDIAHAVSDAVRYQGTWTFENVVAYSVGLVLRELVPAVSAPNRDARMRAIAAQSVATGLEVLFAQRIADTDVRRYVHRAARGTVVEPYRTRLILGGELIPAGAWLAIGQSRHLGGGLLIPKDVPAEVLTEWGFR